MIFRSKRALMDEITHLSYRVKELEERLCPSEEHDWKLAASKFTMISPYDVQQMNDFLCRRCGKRKTEYDD